MTGGKEAIYGNVNCDQSKRLLRGKPVGGIRPDALRATRHRPEVGSSGAHAPRLAAHRPAQPFGKDEARRVGQAAIAIFPAASRPDRAPSPALRRSGRRQVCGSRRSPRRHGSPRSCGRPTSVPWGFRLTTLRPLRVSAITSAICATKPCPLDEASSSRPSALAPGISATMRVGVDVDHQGAAARRSRSPGSSVGAHGIEAPVARGDEQLVGRLRMHRQRRVRRLP